MKREEWGKRGPKKYLRGTKVYLSISSAEQFPHTYLAWSLSSLGMAATDDRAAHPCCPIGFLKLARTAVMRVCVVHGHHWVTGLPLEQGARCWRRLLAMACGVRRSLLRHYLPCLLATREATCAISTSYRGNFPNLDVLPWACHWAGRGRSSTMVRGVAHRPGSHAHSPHFT